MRSIIFLAAGVAILGGVVYWTGWNEALNTVLLLSPGVIGLVVILQLVTVLLASWQWYIILREPPGFVARLRVLQVHVAGSLVDTVTPGAKIGGELARVYWWRRLFGYDYACLAGKTAGQKYITLLPLFIFCLAALASLACSGLKHPALTTAWWALAGAAALLLIFAAAFKFLPLPGVLNEARRSVKEISGNGNSLFILFLLSSVIWGLYPLKLYVLSLSLNLGLDFWVIAAAALPAYLTGMVPLLPGGMGTYEAGLVTFLVLMGADPAGAGALALAYRMVNFLFPVITGGVAIIFLLTLNRQKNKKMTPICIVEN